MITVYRYRVLECFAVIFLLQTFNAFAFDMVPKNMVPDQFEAGLENYATRRLVNSTNSCFSVCFIKPRCTYTNNKLQQFILPG